MTHGTQGTRREDHEDTSFVRTVKTADAGITLAWRWIMILVFVAGFFIQVGIQIANNKAMGEQLADVRADFASLRKDLGDFRKENTDLVMKTERNTNEITRLVNENDELKSQLSESRADQRQLLGWLNEMRNMREAYVYDSAKAARNKLLQQATTPP